MCRFIILLMIFSFDISVYASPRWSLLEEGDVVEVFASGYGSNDGSLEKARTNLANLNLRPNNPNDLINTQHGGYANTAIYRAKHIQQINESKTKAAWALRGGRGSSQILSFLSEDKLQKIDPTLFIGYSDITTIHLQTALWGWPFLHAPVLAYNKDTNSLSINKEATMKSVVDILTGKIQELTYPLTSLNDLAKNTKTHTISSSVVGGNLSVIQRSIGTNTQLKTSGKILFLEDTNEDPTRLDEVFNHLMRAKSFDAVTGVILGNFTFSDNQKKQDFYKGAAQTLCGWMDTKGIPVLSSERFGHGEYNDPLPFNTPAVLSFDDAGLVTLKVKTNN